MTSQGTPLARNFSRMPSTSCPIEMFERLATEDAVEATELVGLDIGQFGLEDPDLGMGVLRRQAVEGGHREAGVVQHGRHQTQSRAHFEHRPHVGQVLQQMDLEPLVRDPLFGVVAEPVGPAAAGSLA